jgi:hypothetical protein
MNKNRLENQHFDKLPSDIIYNICNKLSLKDVFILKHVNVELRCKILSIERYIMRNELKKIPFLCLNNFYEMKQELYKFIKYHLDVQRNKYKIILVKYYLQDIKNYTLKNYILNFKYYHNSPQICYSYPLDYITYPTQNYFINEIFDRIFEYYVKNNFGSLEKYPNQLDLVVLYIFLHIEIYQNVYNMDYFLEFLRNLNKNQDSSLYPKLENYKYYNVCIKYYTHCLNIILDDNILINNSFEKLYEISKYVTNVPILKKLLGYKLLDINPEFCHLFLCCFECIPTNLQEICTMKMSFWKDDLISYNYLQIKNLLKIKCPLYYNILLEKETYEINEIIQIKNPYTNRRMRVNGSLFKRFIKFIYESNPHYHNRIVKFIYNKQKYFRRKFFD